MADFKYSADIGINLDVKSASSQLKDLQNQLKQIGNMDFNLNGLGISEEIAEASKAALELQSHLKAATNISTDNLDFTKLNVSLKQSGISLEEYGRKLIALGPEGQKAFMNLSTAISQSEIQMTKSSKLLNTAFENLKKTVGWQISSSIVNNFTGSIQRAIGYAQDLNKSLTDIRIVTGASTEQMASFAREANKAAKNLSTTTTDYTKASLIYYQQGLSDAEVKARTETTIKMANATGTSAQKVSDQMTAIWNNYDNGTKSLTHYADVMTALGAATASSTDEIAEGLQKFASISDTVGLSYEYAASALATITATSRESADVVGNSLKTLFSRIQGLQLGETLDDGTTLNKYSTAMAKVGISIKNSSGELKDMDVILDEMGAKWQTLARDEQMALAQTVAGVRQYTQLMTLMENWDEFKQNVNIANASDGTLDKQAEIYAQSWEAASNRMRAAFEGLWDNLINDDAVIGIMNFFSGVISGIDGLVSALGGAGGTLLSFGSIFTRIFGDNIAQNIKEISSDIYKLTPKYREKQQASKEALAAELRKAQSEFGTNSARSKVFKAQSEEATTKDVERQQRRERLSDVDKEIYDRKKAKVDAAREAERKAAEGIDAAAEKRADAVIDNDDVLNLDENYYSEKENKKREKRRKELENKTGDRTAEEEAELKRIQEKKGKKSEDEKKTAKEIQKKRSKAEAEELKQLQRQAAESGISRKEKINQTAQKNEDFLSQLSGITSKQAFDKLADDIYGADAPDIAKALKKNLAEAISDSDSENISKDIVDKVARKTTDKALKAVADGIEYGPDETPDEDGRKRRQQGAENYAQAQADDLRENRNLTNAQNAKKEATADLDKPLPSETKMPVDSWANTLVEGAEGIMEVTAAGQALGGVMQSVSDGTATLGSALVGLASGGYQAVSGLSSLQSALSQIPKLAGIAGPLSLAITAIATLGPIFAELFDMFNTSADELSQSIARSTENLQNAANDAAQAVTTLQRESKTHLETVEQIESYSQDPATMASEIYEANKQAIDMIAKYGQDWVEGKEYTTDQNTGLIKIEESALKEAQDKKESAAMDLERTANLASATQQLQQASLTFSELTGHLEKDVRDGLENASIERLLEYQTNGGYFQAAGDTDPTYFTPEEMKEIIQAYQSGEQAQLLIDLISQQNVGKILEEKDYNAQNIEGYKFLQNQASEVYSTKYQEVLGQYAAGFGKGTVGGIGNGWNQIDEDQIDLIKEYLELQGHNGITGLKYRNGEIQYYSSDTSGQQSIEWEDVRRWKAEQEAEKAITGVGEDGKSWLDKQIETNQGLYKNYGKGADAILSFGEFGNLNQVSIEALKAAKNITQATGEINTALKNQEFDKFTKAVDKALVPVDTFESLFKNLGETTIDYSALSAESLQNLNNNINDFVGEAALIEAQEWLSGEDKNQDGQIKAYEDMSKEAQNLVEYTQGIEQMLQASGLDAEGMAQAFNQIAQMDWTEDAGTNLRNIVQTINELGGDINLADWDHLRGTFQDLSGIMPDYSGTIDQLITIQALLNSLQSGGTITKEIAIMLKMYGINAVSDGKGGYIVTSSQDDIDAAAEVNQKEINEKVANQRKVSSAYNDYKAAGGSRTTGFKSYDDLVAATDPNSSTYDPNLANFLNTATGTDLGTNIQNGSAVTSNTGTSGPGDVWYNTPWMRAFLKSQRVDTEGWEESTTGFGEQEVLDEVNGLIEAGQTGVPDNDIAELTATYDNAADLMKAINGKDSAFRDKNGLVNNGTLEYLSALPETSARATAAINQFVEAENNLQEIRRQAEADGEISDDEQADIDYAQRVSDEAAAYAELQSAIDAVAEARGLDADIVARHAEQFEEQVKAGELTSEVAANMAADLAAQAEGLEECAKSGRDWLNAITQGTKGTKAYEDAFSNLSKSMAKVLKIEDQVTKGAVKMGKAFEDWIKKNPGKAAKAMAGDLEAGADAMEQIMVDTYGAKAATEEGQKAWDSYAKDTLPQLSDVWKELDSAGLTEAGTDISAAMASLDQNTASAATSAFNFVSQWAGVASQMGIAADAVQAGIQAMGFDIVPISAEMAAEAVTSGQGVLAKKNEVGWEAVTQPPVPGNTETSGSIQYYKIVSNGGPGGGSPGRGGGGGGGGGAKEPKKVAQTRRSQVVKRYKNVDAQRSTNKNRRENMSNKTDKLYGEAKITNLEKENKLLEEGLKLNQKKSEEAMKNLKLDQEALVTVGQKYGYEVKFDSEGNLENYEEILGDLYDQLHALEADNLMDESEEKVKEEIEIKKTEIEGAIEDLEDTLEQLQELNNEYEEMIDEMHENNLEKITYRLEFELELNELDTEWNDFLLEQIDDDFTQTAAAMDLVIKKITTASENIEHYKQSVTDLIELIENDPDRSLITGYLEDGVLTDEEAEILKEAYSGIIEQIEAIAEAKEEAEDRLISIFEGYNERIDLDMTSLEHYASLLEHFGNVVDIVGQKQLGLSDKFMETMSNMRIDQSRDIISAAQTNLSAMQKIKAEAEAELEKAREEGRTNDIDYWQERLDEANTAIEESRDELVAAFENSLTAIADAFDAAMERVIDTFNNTIYAFGGLEGLSADYAIMKETSDLIAADYEKIYELSKITRNINKTLSDSNIIAGKQKMLDLQKEINELQANGTEMSKYDLEYLQAKYELRLAEIELENAQNNKDTVRLSKDSEGNWSYIYTSSTDAVEEAQQKYEDALYNMQNLSYEYIDEMSEKIVSASQSMAEEIAAIDKTKFKDEVELMEEVNRIKQKYAEQLGLSEEELNKALANNNDLYNQDWQLYNQKTGYAVSSAQDWIDSYRETALGQLTGSESDVSDYMDNFLAALDELTESIKRVASDYYFNVNETMKAAGITKDDFGNFVLSNTTAINKASENTKKNIETQTQNLVKDFNTQADKVTENQRILNDYVEENRDYLEWIKNWLNESSQKTKEQQGKDATYTYKEAAELFNSKYANIANGYEIELTEDGKWSKTIEGVKNEILSKHQAAKESGDKELQAHYADMYTWLTSYILPYTTSLDTGGYTGAWGTSGKLAMLHEKELVLNAEDTANFLDALHISRDIINSMIEMNARQSSYALGGMTPGVLQDMSQKLEQQVSIMAEFPNATDHNEIEEAFNNLINTASQYANKYNI